ncbi:hypothetical protein [Brevibacillus laterosporus]|uniref:hypothetical protein n=1 Tax=Brevibacillus laterosporus TaxID=1465 RepID=UPI00215B9EBC|nr:hypothetical protein [Brevibacillus laterosporus]MCR8998196.1 hypothetical protein [Brevibacillus laterosporus]
MGYQCVIRATLLGVFGRINLTYHNSFMATERRRIDGQIGTRSCSALTSVII